MILDPTIVVAIVNAAGGLLQKVLDLATGSSREAGQVISKVYEKVADNISPNSLRVLVALKNAGAFQLAEQIIEMAQQAAARQEPTGRPLEGDITYRLRYMCLLGLVRVGTSDFALTDLGDAFIERARNDKYRYGKVFSEFGAR
jgi:hypothetical protein